MFVPMLHGRPIAADFQGDASIGERFWYWRGASGESYIHSVYPLNDCPPLPGALFIAVSNAGGRPRPVGLGRFPLSFKATMAETVRHALPGVDVDEVHVHLLAKGETRVHAVASDLRLAFDDGGAGGGCPGYFSEEKMRPRVEVYWPTSSARCSSLRSRMPISFR